MHFRGLPGGQVFMDRTNEVSTINTNSDKITQLRGHYIAISHMA